MSVIRNLDKIFDILVDTQWHNLDELRNRTSLPAEKMDKLLSFLKKQALINVHKEKLRITDLGLKFAEL